MKSKFQRVFLFGSRARGDHLRESDVDVIVVDGIFEGVPYVEMVSTVRRAIRDVVERYPVDVDIIAVTPEEFDELSKKPTNIVGYAVKRGEVVEVGKRD